MGRLPLQFAGKDITFRVPYEIPGELQLAASAQANQFPEATFLHNVEKPFEIHRVIIRTSALDNSDPPVVLTAQPTILDKLVRVQIRDTSKNEALTKAAQLIDTMLKANERTWEWEDPYTIVRSEGFEISASTDANYPDGTTLIRLEITLQGYLIVIDKPSESR
jgi:hypothetical protein